MFSYKFPTHTKEDYIKVMLEYRVKPCKEKGCSSKNCFNYHGESERRRPPVFLSTRASECPETKDKGTVRYDQKGWPTCSRGEDCPFFHTLSEWFHPASYKRRKHDESTSCYVTAHYGTDPIYCSYLHDEDDPEVIKKAREEALQILKDREDKREKKIVSEQRREKRKRKQEREEEEKREWALLDALLKSENDIDDFDDTDNIDSVIEEYNTSKSPSLSNSQERKSKKDRKKEKKGKKGNNNNNNNNNNSNNNNTGVSTPSEPTTPTNTPIQVTPIRETPPKMVDQITPQQQQQQPKGNQSKRAKTPKSPTLTLSDSSSSESNQQSSSSSAPSSLSLSNSQQTPATPATPATQTTPTTSTNKTKTSLSSSAPSTTQPTQSTTQSTSTTNKTKTKTSTSTTPISKSQSSPTKIHSTKDKSSLQSSNSNDSSTPQPAQLPQPSTTSDKNDHEPTKETKQNSECKSVYEEYEEKEVGLPLMITPLNVSRHKGKIIAITPSWIQIRTSQDIYFILETSRIWGLPSDWQERRTLRCGLEVFLDSELQRDLKSGHIASYGCLLLPTQSSAIASSISKLFLKSRPPFVTTHDAHTILNNQQLNRIRVNLASKDMLQTTPPGSTPPPMYTFELFDDSTVRDLKLKCALRLNKPIGSISIGQMSEVMPPLYDDQVVRNLGMGYGFQSVDGCDASLDLTLGHQEMHDKICSAEEWKSVVMEIGYICYSEYWGIYFECLNYYLSSIVDMSIKRNWMFDECNKTFVDTWLQSPITFESIFLVFFSKPNGLMGVQYELSDRSNKKDVFVESANRTIKESVARIEEVCDENCVYSSSSEGDDLMPSYLPPDTALVCDVPMLSDRVFISLQSCEEYTKWLTESSKLMRKLFSRNKSIAVPSYNPQTSQVVFYLPLYEVLPANCLPSSQLTTQPKVLYVAEAQKVTSHFGGNVRTLLVVHSVVSPIVAYMNTRIAGSNMPAWMIHAIGMGKPDPMQEVAIGMRKYAMQRKVIDKGNSQDIGLLLRESFDYIDRIAAKTVPTYDYQSMTDSFQAARNIISGRAAYNFNIQLDAVCFVCGNGAHHEFRVAKYTKKEDSDACDDDLWLMPYIKCEHCGNYVRAYKVMPIRVNLTKK